MAIARHSPPSAGHKTHPDPESLPAASAHDRGTSDSGPAPESHTLTLDTDRSIVLVGLMGAGKSVVGRRIATKTGRRFVDADSAIEDAAGCSIAEVFARYGEDEFRAGEKRVMERLLSEPRHIIAAGGGAFMAPETRENIQATGLSVWLNVDLDTLVARTQGRSHRPLLNAENPRTVLARLMEQRSPTYAQADITITTAADATPDETATAVIHAIQAFLTRSPLPAHFST